MNKHLYKDKSKGLIAGVCVGLADYTNIPAFLFRLLFFMTSFLGFMIYVALALFLPDKGEQEKLVIENFRKEMRVVEKQLQTIEKSVVKLENYITSDEFEYRLMSKDFSDQGKDFFP